LYIRKVFTAVKHPVGWQFNKFCGPTSTECNAEN
jgi:hypothetical protein